MMATIDGKIGSSFSHVDIVDDFLDIYRSIDNGIAPHAWMCGRVTTQLYFAKNPTTLLPEPFGPIPEGHFIAKNSYDKYYITPDITGVIRWDSDFVSFYPEHGKLHVIVLVTEETPDRYLHLLRSKGISYIICGGKSLDFSNALTLLQEYFGITHLLIEGGAKLNGSLMHEQLIDDIYLLIVPRVLNQSGSPGIFEKDTDRITNLPSYTLKEIAKKDRNCVLLHYQR